MTPKSLLRNAARGRATWTTSRDGSFQRVIPDTPAIDPAAGHARAALHRQGLLRPARGARRAQGPTTSPSSASSSSTRSPPTSSQASSRRCRRLTELVWVQEEPRNMGAWHFMLPPPARTGFRARGWAAAQGRVRRPRRGRQPRHRLPPRRTTLEQQLLVEASRPPRKYEWPLRSRFRRSASRSPRPSSASGTRSPARASASTSRSSCSRPTRSPSTCPPRPPGTLGCHRVQEGDKVTVGAVLGSIEAGAAGPPPPAPPPPRLQLRRPRRRRRCCRSLPAPAAEPDVNGQRITPTARRDGRGPRRGPRPGQGHRPRRPHPQGGRAGPREGRPPRPPCRPAPHRPLPPSSPRARAPTPRARSGCR